MRAPLQVNIAASPAHRNGLRRETPSPSTTRYIIDSVAMPWICGVIICL
jgi:hypothetical protein